MAGDQWSGLWSERGGAVEGRAAINSGGKGGAWHQFCVEAISGTRRVLPVGLGSVTGPEEGGWTLGKFVPAGACPGSEGGGDIE